MPKRTFFNLSDDKRKKVYEALLDVYKEKPFKDVTVREIVGKLGIPRGSFYQYFESLDESYFYVLGQELIDVHESFAELVRANDMEISKALDEFGERAADEIFKDDCYMLYRNRYLGFDAGLEKEWREYIAANGCGRETAAVAERETAAFIGAVIHSLIQRAFIESWSREEFAEHYRLHVGWIKRGIEK